MKKFVIATSVLAFMAVSDAAMADNNNPALNFSDAPSHPFRIGFGLDAGVPSGLGIGVVVHPKADWISAEASFTFALAPGGRLALQLDPIAAAAPKLPIGLFADVQGGFAQQGNIPGQANFPMVGYDYFNTYLGLRLGKASGFQWVLEGGPTYIHINTNNFQSFVNQQSNVGLSLGNPSLSGWAIPTFMTGFRVVFP